MDNIRLYTCMVGRKPTHANFYVNEVSEVEAVVARMAGTDVAQDGAAQDRASIGASAGLREGGGGGAEGAGVTGVTVVGQPSGARLEATAV